MRAKTPYNNAHGQAIRICWWSIDNAVTNSFDADTAHHKITNPVNIVPIIPLEKEEKDRNIDTYYIILYSFI